MWATTSNVSQVNDQERSLTSAGTISVKEENPL